MKRSTVAVLRKACGLYQKEFADLIGCSVPYLQKIEQTAARGGKPLTARLAQSIWHQTGVSLDWLRKGDVKVPAISSRGEKYSEEIFIRAQAEKKAYDRPHPFFLNNDALQCCARAFGILRSARKGEKYYIAIYKLGSVLDKLELEFGREPGIEFTNTQIALLTELIEQGRDPVGAAHRFNAALRRSKRSSKKARRRS